MVRAHSLPAATGALAVLFMAITVMPATAMLAPPSPARAATGPSAGEILAQAPAGPQAPSPAPAPAPVAPASPAPAGEPPAGAPGAAPADPPAPSEPSPAPGDAFGAEVDVPQRTVIFFKGTANWDTAYETLLDAFKLVRGYLAKEGIKAAGPAMTIYIATDDAGFEFQAAVPIAEPMAKPPRGDLEMGSPPSGKMLKFVHRGSYDAMDSTYEAITNYLDSKQLEAQDTFIEEYATDPLSTPEADLVINVLVPVK